MGRKPELYRPHNLYIIYNYLYNSYKKTGYPGRDLYQRVAGLKRFAEIMRIKPSIKESDDPVRLTDVKGDIELNTWNSGYSGGQDVLKDVSLSIEQASVWQS